METVWKKYDQAALDEVNSFCEEYRRFLSSHKTERECTGGALEIARKHGYRDLQEYISTGTMLKPGDKVYAINRGKNFAAFMIGEQPMEKGIKLLGAHIDSPRLDLKQHPLFEDTGVAFGKTHYYGGIKKYQWVTVPMALHGVVCLKDGTVKEVVIGEDPSDPVLGITDLLIHLSGEQMKKSAAEALEGEQLNITLGTMPLDDEKEEPVKKNILKIFKDRYGFEEEDLISAELEVVPAGEARDYGMDRSMVIGYGHDDRVCAYTSLMALMDMEKVDRTTAVILVDKEEIGSVGATGMQSHWFDDVLAEVMELIEGFSELKMRRLHNNSDMLSNDVSAAYDPNFPSVMEKNNSAYMGKGLCINKYVGARGKSGTNDADPEYIARVRQAFDLDDAAFQTGEIGKVDAGGGGTTAYIMANLGMSVVDAGVPVWSMHSPWEVVSKADVYEAYKAYKAFIRHI